MRRKGIVECGPYSKPRENRSAIFLVLIGLNVETNLNSLLQNEPYSVSSFAKMLSTTTIRQLWSLCNLYDSLNQLAWETWSLIMCFSYSPMLNKIRRRTTTMSMKLMASFQDNGIRYVFLCWVLRLHLKHKLIFRRRSQIALRTAIIGTLIVTKKVYNNSITTIWNCSVVLQRLRPLDWRNKNIE